MKSFITAFIILLLPVTLHAEPPNWKNVCPDNGYQYCDSIGKDAYNNSTFPETAQNIKLGKITGVSWRPKGSVIGVSEAIPAANIPESVRRSTRDAFYYIIDDGSGKPFLRQCREINAK